MMDSLLGTQTRYSQEVCTVLVKSWVDNKCNIEYKDWFLMGGGYIFGYCLLNLLFG